MPSDPDRVYIGDEKEAPEDAIVRQSNNGRLYYCPKERGSNNHNGGNKDNGLLETSRQDLLERAVKGELVGKPFEGPEGQEFEDFEDCVSTISDDDTSEQEAKEICGSWQADHEAKNRRVYVGKQSEIPDGVEAQEDAQGRLFYRQQDVWEEARLFYPEDARDLMEDETDADLEEGEQTEGVDSEEAAEQHRDDLASQAEEEFGE